MCRIQNYLLLVLLLLCFSAALAGTVTDIDGNVYQTVTIGNQVWMAENLKVTHYRNGDAIPKVTICGDASGDGKVNLLDVSFIINALYRGGPQPDPKELADVNKDGKINLLDVSYIVNYLYRQGPVPDCGSATWNNLTTGAYCEYNNNVNNVATYGRLYNWYAATNGRNIAPVGWHVPTDAEWKQLEMHIGMSQSEADAEDWRGTDEGGKLKEMGTTHWASPNVGATNESGFFALPGGYRSYDGGFYSKDSSAFFWSSTEGGGVNAWYRVLGYDYAAIYRYYGYGKLGGFSVRCVKDQVPVLTTASVSAITQATAQCGGSITSDGGASVTAHGVCWSTNPIPTVADDTTNDGTGIGSFISSIIGLTAGTPYYVRAYATNSVGTGYGSVQSFATAASSETVTDIDGNVYQTVMIGTQLWMAENLKVTHYRNGDDIPNVTDSATWAGLITGAYCEYNNDVNNVAVYGRLYNWFAVGDGRNIAPAGWHVPTDAEWKQLEMYLGMSQVEVDADGWRGTDEGGKLKETGTAHWANPNTGATNESDFSGLPGGCRGIISGVDYYGMNNSAFYWSSTGNPSFYPWYRDLNYNNAMVYRNYDTYRQHGSSVRCVKDLNDDVPTLTTATVSVIAHTTAQCGGTITSEGGSPVTARGVCWSTNLNPTTADNKTNDGNGTGSFSSSIFGLTAGTPYFVRAYATNSAGTGYGNVQSFTTAASSGTVTDIDGNVYQTVTIGTQLWMAENLKVTHYRNGDAIPNVTDGVTWAGLTTGAYCEYNNDVNNVAVYGRLYNWYSVNDGRNIAPAGWHVPTDVEWEILVDYLGDSAVAGGKMKEPGTAHWWSPNTGATNESGFTGLPGGGRYGDGIYVAVGYYGNFWSSTELYSLAAFSRQLTNDHSAICRGFPNKLYGLSIRCIMEKAPVLTTATVNTITQTTAQCGGNITSDGGASVTARGVCWSTNPTPTTADDTTNDGVGTGSFTSAIIGLTANTSYYVRAYSTNSVGTGYGDTHSFTTAVSPGTVTDIDGNVYQTVTIGTQVWMAENLKVTHYRNGDDIPIVTDNATWQGLTTGAYCEYNNDINNVATYGRLYNWYAVADSRNIAPAGWHVPTDEEWKQLEMYLGMSQAQADATSWRGTDEGGKLKENGTTHWASPNTGATNESGFAGLPGGDRYDDGIYYNIYSGGLFWSSTEDYSQYAYNRFLSSIYSEIGRFSWLYHKRCGFSVRCVRDKVPVLTTTDVSEITQTTAQCGGTITSGGGEPVTARGVCWSVNPNPTIANDTTNDGVGAGSFTSIIIGLTANSPYYVRAYATNSVGTGYGNTQSFTTAGTVTDIDGNVYQTVTIGTQVWMAENLKVTHYRNGEDIPNITNATTWSGLTTGAYCEYNNDINNVAVYGRLYNWYAAVDSRKIAPTGWHVPTDAEWKQLEMYLGMSQAQADAEGLRGTDEGGKLKEAGTTYWSDPNTGATNESGFSGLPGGYRSFSGPYEELGNCAGFWSSTESSSNLAWYRYLYYSVSVVYRYDDDGKRIGFSVRCIRDY